MTATGGTGTGYTFSATGLPTGLTMSSSGTISGTPTVSGTFPYTVTVTDSKGNKGTFNCSVTVNGPPTASCVSISAVQGVAITPVTLTGSGGAGGPYTFSATGLPTGLTMSSSGTISGTPTVSGTFNYTVTVTDSKGNKGTVSCSVTVYSKPSCACVSITAYKGVAITPTQLTGSGGAGGPYTFSATGLPAGLSVSTSGVISGTPTVSGTFTYTVTVTDKNGNQSSYNCTITVKVDNTPPVCSVYENANPPYMSYQDTLVGIVRLDVTTNSNFNVQITPTPTGTKFTPSVPSQPYPMPTGEAIVFPAPVTSLIDVSATVVNTKQSAQLTVKATNAAGLTVTCDPIAVTVMIMKNDDGAQTLTNIPYAEHFIRVENGGLHAIDFNVNGTMFKVRRLSDDQVVTIDVSSAMKNNRTNTITIIPKGHPGESAYITIGPSAS